MTWWQIVIITLSSGTAVLIGIGGTIFIGNYSGSADYMNTRWKLKELEIQKLKLIQEIDNDKRAHELKLLGSSES